MKKSVFNILITIITVLYVVVVATGNISYITATMATAPGSYAEKFCKMRSIEDKAIPESKRHFFDVKYNTFDYFENESGKLSIEKYRGISESVVIPKAIGSREVNEIGANILASGTIKEMYIPDTIKTIKFEPTKSVTLYCDKDSEFYKKNAESEEWDIKTMYDSTYVDYYNADIPFGYNEGETSVKVVTYDGDDDILVIPAYINGKPVTEMSMDILGKYDLVVVPATITSITGEVSKLVYSKVMLIELIFSIIALIVSILMINIIVPRYSKNLNEYFLSTPQLIITAAYLIAQIYVSIKFIYGLGYKEVASAAAVSGIILLAYIVLMSIANRGREHVNKINKKIEVNTDNVRKLQSLVRGLSDGITDLDVKKQVDRVIDSIRYIPAESINGEAEAQVASEIATLKAYIANGDKENILHSCNSIISLMKNR